MNKIKYSIFATYPQGTETLTREERNSISKNKALLSLGIRKEEAVFIAGCNQNAGENIIYGWCVAAKDVAKILKLADTPEIRASEFGRNEANEKDPYLPLNRLYIVKNGKYVKIEEI